MQEAFERYIVSGQLLRKGAHDNQHQVFLHSVMLHQHDVSGKSDTVKLHGALMTLQPGQSLKRNWICQKDGFQKVFALDKWCHVETICKISPDKLIVRDQIIWHEGKSKAQRDYTVQTNDDKMSLNMRSWSIDLAGLPWPVRGFIQGILQTELPKAADKSINDFYESRALPPPESS